MAWHDYYYYRSKKVQGRVEREYLGNSSVAELADAVDALERSGHQAERIDR